MSKSQTPLQQAIQELDEYYKSTDSGDGAENALLYSINYLKDLLPVEREFARDLFEAGINAFDEFDKSFNYGDQDVRQQGITELFTEYYTTFE